MCAVSDMGPLWSRILLNALIWRMALCVQAMASLLFTFRGLFSLNIMRLWLDFRGMWPNMVPFHIIIVINSICCR